MENAVYLFECGHHPQVKRLQMELPGPLSFSVDVDGENSKVHQGTDAIPMATIPSSSGRSNCCSRSNRYSHQLPSAAISITRFFELRGRRSVDETLSIQGRSSLIEQVLGLGDLGGQGIAG